MWRPGTLNRFAYTTNNPVNLVDPLGYDGGILEGVLKWGSAALPAISLAIDIATLAPVTFAATPLILLLASTLVPDYPRDIPFPEPHPAPPPVLPREIPRLGPPPPLGPFGKDTATGKDPWMEPQPRPEPQSARPDPIAPAPTRTPEPKEKHISLGLNFVGTRPALFWFTRQLNERLNPLGIYVYSYGEWEAKGLSDVSIRYFSVAFDQASTRAKGIHFNLEGIPYPNLFAERFGSQGRFAPGAIFTADELYLIKTRPQLCNKTTFYRFTESIYSESISDWQEICHGKCDGGE